MAEKTVKIMLEVTVRDFTKEEREQEGYSFTDCRGAAGAFDADGFAEGLAHYVETSQNEILAGSGAMVKIVSASASPQ